MHHLQRQAHPSKLAVTQVDISKDVEQAAKEGLSAEFTYSVQWHAVLYSLDMRVHKYRKLRLMARQLRVCHCRPICLQQPCWLLQLLQVPCQACVLPVRVTWPALCGCTHGAAGPHQMHQQQGADAHSPSDPGERLAE